MSDYLCEELIVEILTRLPPKSLLRFNTLSKSLCSIISSPDFIRMHTFRSPQKLLIRHRSCRKKDSDVKAFYTLHSEDQLPLCPRRGYSGITPVRFPYSRHSNIVGSCNGILCLFNQRKNCIRLWNPSIRCKLTLPGCPQRCLFKGQIGFGLDPITDDFKIVMIRNPASRGSSYVYAMKTGAWCAIASPRPLFSKVISEMACFVNGALHWLVERYYIEPDDVVRRRDIMTFDLSTHDFGTIVLPESSLNAIELTTIQGSLAVVAIDIEDGLIWVRRDDFWSVVLKWKTNQVKGGLKRILPLASNGDLLFHTYCSGFQVYNPKIGVQQSTLVPFNGASSLGSIVPCVESLQMLDVGTTV